MGLRRRELRLGSGVRRLGTAAGLNCLNSVATPAQILGANLLSWFEAVPGFLFNSNVDSTPTADGGLMGFMVDRRDTFASQAHPTASNTGGAAGLTWSSAHKAIVADGFSAMLMSSAVTVSPPCTFYALGRKVKASGFDLTWCPFGDTANGIAGIGVDSGGNFDVQTNDNINEFVTTFANLGLTLLRLRSTSVGAWSYSATGKTLQTGITGNVALTTDTLGWMPGNLYSAVGAEHAAWMICNIDTVAGGQDAAIRSYFASIYPGATIP